MVQLNWFHLIEAWTQERVILEAILQKLQFCKYKVNQLMENTTLCKIFNPFLVKPTCNFRVGREVFGFCLTFLVLLNKTKVFRKIRSIYEKLIFTLNIKLNLHILYHRSRFLEQFNEGIIKCEWIMKGVVLVSIGYFLSFL